MGAEMSMTHKSWRLLAKALAPDEAYKALILADIQLALRPFRGKRTKKRRRRWLCQPGRSRTTLIGEDGAQRLTKPATGLPRSSGLML